VRQDKPSGTAGASSRKKPVACKDD
jgi:hypothetical protein